jgi:nucleolar protein 53
MPHQGVSYNPLASAHQDLLRSAHEIEARREKEAEKNEEWTAKMEKARRAALVEHTPGVPVGMTVSVGDDDDDGDGGDNNEWSGIQPTKRPERKTKKQRAKAAKILAEVR